MESLEGEKLSLWRIADQGCGKLRHVALLSSVSRELFCVDTERQLKAPHRDGQTEYTIPRYLELWTVRSGVRCRALTDQEFARAGLFLDAVFCVCVLDVVPNTIRPHIVSAAARNIRKGGYYAIIIPRNDSSILRRCQPANAWRDGHVFPHQGIHTFFRNFSNHRPVIELIERHGFELSADLSRYRQICCLFRRL